MADGDLRDQIARIEADIDKLAQTLDGCRKAMLLSKAAIVAGGIWMLAYLLGAIRFDSVTDYQRNGGRYWGRRRFWIKFEYVEAGNGSDESRRDTASRVDRHDRSSDGRRKRGWLVRNRNAAKFLLRFAPVQALPSQRDSATSDWAKEFTNVRLSALRYSRIIGKPIARQRN